MDLNPLLPYAKAKKVWGRRRSYEISIEDRDSPSFC
jgi:hypothetical protein